MINFLEAKEFLELNLWFSPGPKHIPRIFKIHAVRKLSPVGCPIE
jgi:hypothetical protein